MLLIIAPNNHVDNMVHKLIEFGKIRGVPECNNIGGFFSSLLFWKRGVGEAFSFLDSHHIRNTCLMCRAKASEICADVESDVPHHDFKSAVSGPKRFGHSNQRFT